MEAQIEKIYEAAVNQLGPDFQRIQPTANLKMQTLLQKCYQGNSDDPSNFAECVLDGQNKIADLMEKFQYKSIYLRKSANVCLQQNKEKGKCQAQVIDIGKKLVKDMIKQIQKV